MRKKNDLSSHQLNLTSLQKELWLSHLGMPEKHPGISCGGLFELDGMPDAELLKQSLEVLVHHFSLLSSTLRKTRDVFPVFEPAVWPKPDFTCLDFKNDLDPEQSAQAALREFVERPFSPIGGSLCRFILLNIADHRSIFANRFFHLAGDGIVCITHFNIMVSIYNDLQAGHRVDPGVIQDWQDDVDQDRKHLASARGEKDKAFWREQLQLLPRESIFPPKPGRPDRVETIARLEYDLPLAVTDRLIRFSEAGKAGISDIMMALHLLVLSRLYDRNRLVVQVPFRYGEHRNQWAIHGHRVNVVPLWLEIGAETTFLTLLADIKRRMLALLRRTRTPFQLAFRDSGGLQELTRIWDASFVFFGQAVDGSLGNIRIQQVSPLTSRYEPVVFGVYLIQATEDRHLHFSIDYSKNHFSRQDVHDYLARLEQVTSEILDAPPSLLKQCDVLLPREHETLRKWQAGPVVRFKNGTIPELFERRAAANGDRPAITVPGATRSYRSVSHRSDTIAAWLIENGIGRGDVVAVLARRHVALAETILGIMKAGAVYLPVDSALPDERIRHMLTDSGAAKIIALEERDVGTLPEGFAAEMIPDALSPARVPAFHDPQAVAYLIYTSGSTGTPKGVLVSHAGFVNMIQAQIRFFGITPTDHVLQFASPSFDASLSEIFMALLAGAQLYPIPRSLIDEPWSLREFMAEHRISVVTFPPSYLRLFNREPFPGLRVLITAGEPPLPDDVRHYAAELDYINAYGPTEASVCAGMTRLSATEAGNTGLIGRPVANTFVYILDSTGFPVAPGIPGELCLAGAGLARGYLNRPELTAKSFIRAAFDPELRLYRTGDRAVWNPDGTINLYGRLDDQIKIRGHRIEPGEVRTALETFPEIGQAELLAVSDSNRQRDLVAFLVADDSVELESAQLRERLRQQLPEYMIPSRFYWLGAMPLGATGKVDRGKLRQQARNKTGQHRPAAGKDPVLESAVRTVFEEILEESVTATDTDFFSLGGDSIRIVELGRCLSERFGHTFSTRQLLADSSIAGVTARLQQGRERKVSSGYKGGILQLNQSQRQLWVLNQMHPDSAEYNMPLAVEIRAEQFDPELMVRALCAAADRQPSCRVVVTGDIDRPLFRLGHSAQLAVERHDLRRISHPEAACRKLFHACIHHPFRLDSAPPLRALLVQFDDGCWRLLLVMHHIIGDGTSLRIFLKECLVFLQQNSLQQLSPEPLVEFSTAEEMYLQSRQAQQDLSWWQTCLSPLPPRLDLVRNLRPETRRGRGDMVRKTISATTAATLHELAAATGATLLVCFLTIILDFLQRKTGKEGVAVGVPVDLRDSPELFGIIGYFVNTVILRAPDTGSPLLVERIRAIKRCFAATVEHSRYPFSLLAGKLEKERDPSRSPLVDVLATVIDEAAMLADIELPGDWQMKPVEVSLQAAKLDFSFILHVRMSGDMDIVLEYDSDIASRDEALSLLADCADFVQKSAAGEIAAAEKGHFQEETSLDEKLGAVWQQILGVREVSDESNFFACGGDSIKAIQMVGQLRRQGIRGVTPADLFARPEFGRIAALVRNAAQPDRSTTTVQNVRPGDPVVLLPIQRRLVQNHPEHWRIFQMVVPLRLEDHIDDSLLLRAVRELPARHEALRMLFSQTGQASLQEEQDAFVLEERLSVESEDIHCALREVAHRLVQRLDPVVGPIFGGILLRYGDQRILVLGGHHLILDAVSLDILSRELSWFCQYGDWPERQEQCGPAAWAVHLAGQSREPAWLSERQRWLDICSVPTNPPPGFRPGGRDRASERVVLSRRVSLKQPLSSRPQIALLTALAGALYLQGTRESVLVNMEGHGREAVFPGIDVSQSVGWFTITYPLLLSPAEQLGRVREQLAAWFNDLKAGGLGYTILSRDDSESLQYTAQISFNYLGRLTEEDGNGLVPLPESATPAEMPGLLHPDFCSDAPLDIIVYGTGANELVIQAFFSPHCLDQDWIAALLASCEQALCAEEDPSPLRQKMAAACQCRTDEIAAVFELTPPQEAMLYQLQLEGAESLTYTQQINFRLRGMLDESLLVRAWHYVLDRHPGLRSLFPVSADGDIRWLVLVQGRVPVEQIDLRSLPAAMQERSLREKQEYRRSQPFSLDQGPLLFMQLFRLDRNRFEMSWCFHHILMDGWCIGILLRELFIAYEAMGRDALPECAPAPSPGKYLQWLKYADQGAARAFWQEYLADLEQLSPLVQSGFSDRDSSSTMQEEQVELDEGTTAALLECAGQVNVSLSILLQAAWGLLLSAEQGCDLRDVLFGLVTSGRPAEVEGIEAMVGLFIRTVPVRIRCTGTESLAAVLRRVQDDALARAPFEFFSLADIQKCAPVESALFDHILVFENYPLDGIEPKQGLSITAVSGFEQHPYALAVSIIPGRKLVFRFSFDPVQIKRSSLLRLIDRWQALLKALPEMRESSCADILSLVQPTQTVSPVPDTFNATRRPYPRNSSIPELFRAVAARQSEAVAIIASEHVRWSYGQLDRLSDAVAAGLADLNSGEPVAVAMQRGPEAIAVILGILKAGGCYLPVDARNPRKRVAAMVQRAGCGRIIHDLEGVSLLPDNGISRLAAEELLAGSPEQGSAEVDIKAVQPAYIMFTSGSTGEPKGVLVPHRAVLRLACNNGFLEISPEERMLQAAPLGFDASTLEIWIALLNGAALCCISDEALLSPGRLRERVVSDRITVMWLTAGLCNLLIEEDLSLFASLRVLLTGGEALSVSHMAKLMAACPELTVMNGYGPTENTTFTSVHRIVSEDLQAKAIPIGRPVGNTRVYIVREDGSPAEIGEWGELCAAGDGLALGYIGAEELTRASFVQLGAPVSERVYRTGDRVRWRLDGILEFRGRMDNQVKIRGYRIEPAEIEAVLLHIPGVTRAAVVTSGRGEARSLAAFIRWQGSDAEPSVQAIIAELEARLPSYMIPERIEWLDAFPLTDNGKLDRRGLAAQFRSSGPEPSLSRPSGSTLESGVMALYGEILRRPIPSVEADFFQLGGQSLMAMRLLARLNSRFSVALSLRDVLACTTAAALARRIRTLRAQGNGNLQPISRIGELDDYPLSSSQERLWFLQRLQSSSSVYTLPFAVRLQGNLDSDCLQQALYQLEQRHDALRLRVPQTMGNHPLRQQLAAPGALQLTVHDYSESNDPDGEITRRLALEIARPFSFGYEQPLVCALLCRKDDSEAILLLLCHHLICDGLSAGLVVRDLKTAYECALDDRTPSWSDFTVRYVDYAAWQRGMLAGPAGEQLRERWLERLQPLAEPLHLPLDHPRASVRSFAGGVHRFRLDRDCSQGLVEFSRSSGTTLFSALASLVNVFLYRHTGQTDIIIGVPVAGREHPELEQMAGCFVNTLPLFQRLQPEFGFTFLLKGLSGEWQNCLGDQLYPFEALVEALNVSREASRNPVFDVLVALEETSWTAEGEMGEVCLTPYPLEHGFSKVDLSFYFREVEGQLEIDIEYSADLFEPQTIAHMGKRFATLARAALADPDKAIGRLAVMPDSEQRLVVHDFNTTAQSWNLEQTIDGLFREQAARTGTATALRAADGSILSYGVFDRQVQELAHGLVAHHIKPGQLVGVCCSRSPELLRIIFAVLRIGAVYVPFVPGLPPDRVAAMLEDSGTMLLVSEPEFAQSLRHHPVTVLTPDELLQGGDSAVLSETEPEAPAYVLFTSGSTGRPKGVIIEHRSVVNRILWMQSCFPLDTGDVILQKTPVSFDVSVWELFWWSWTGATLAQLPVDGEKDPAVIVQMIAKFRATVIHFVPSMLQIFLQYLENNSGSVESIASLRYVFASGEALTPELVHRFNRLIYQANGTELHNLYGPTEATVDVTWHPCSPLTAESTVPIGRPIANTRIYILDPLGNTCPPGVSGELCISGVQVARGYINRPELTEQCFQEDPFVPGRRMYRTGDLACRRSDGTIDYLGRRDNQVKIRGFRIELGEIESALERSEDVVQAVVRMSELGGMPALEAFLLARDGVELSRSGLRRNLESFLPEYMIPSLFYQVEHIPVNISGKADRKALSGRLLTGSGPGDAEDTPEAARDEDLTPEIQIISEFWRTVLPENVRFDRHENFFEVGGNSLLLVRLHELLEEQWPSVFSLPDLFVDVTVAQQAGRLEQTAVRDLSGADREESAPTSSEAIAVIGMALRLADFDDPDAFWSDLLAGVDRTGCMPEIRRQETCEMLAAIGVQASPDQLREAAYLDDIAAFDCGRFGLAPMDVTLMDPEQRLFLETLFRSLEDAGYGGTALENARVGVFVGASPSQTFKEAVSRSFQDRAEQIYVLNVPSNMAARPGYLMNWNGPAELVDTACSSTLKAVLDGCAALRRGDCDLVVAGGARVLLTPLRSGRAFTIEAGSGRTRTFDAAADGVGAGEGAMAFLLKPLGQARADGDPIRAVIRGGAINQDGRSASIAAPNPAAQGEVIRAAADAAGVELSSLDFFEAHGTATALGDPVEIDGLTRAFSGEKTSPNKAAIGSVKGNYGHLDAAAGGLGLAKAVLALEHGIFPRQPHYQKPNPRINFHGAPVFVAEENYSLDRKEQPWRCGVSAFGLSGINVHLILEQPPPRDFRADDDGWYMVPISSGSDVQLRASVDLFLERITDHPEWPLSAVAATLTVGRTHLSRRLAVVADSLQGCVEQLRNWRLSDAPDKIVSTAGSGQSITTGKCADEQAAQRIKDAFFAGDTPLWPEGEPIVRLHLPPVPLERKRYWPQFTKPEPATGKGVLGPAVETPEGRLFTIPVTSDWFWPMAEHRLSGRPVLVGMAAVSMLAEAVGGVTSDSAPICIRGLNWLRPLAGDEVRSACLRLFPAEKGWQCRLSGQGHDDSWHDYVEARVSRNQAATSGSEVDLVALQQSLNELTFSASDAGEAAVQVSERWNCRKRIWYSADKTMILARLQLQDRYHADLEQLPWHPALLDVAAGLALDRPGLVPSGCREICLFHPLPPQLFALVTRTGGTTGETDLLTTDCLLLDDTGMVLVQIRGLTFFAAAQPQARLHYLEWKTRPLPQGTELPDTPILLVGGGEQVAELAEMLRERGCTVIVEEGAGTAEQAAVLAEKVIENSCTRLCWILSESDHGVWQPLFDFFKVLLNRGLRQPVQLLLAGRGALALDGVSGGRISVPPDGALAMGMLSSVIYEEPLLSGHYLELSGEVPTAALAEELLAPAPGSAEPIVLDGQGNRYGREVADPLAGSEPVSFPKHGVVVISGGLGAMALTLAETIGSELQAAIALLHRGDFPAVGQWQRLLRESKDERLCWRIRTLQKIQEAGIDFRLYSCDVCHGDELLKTLAGIRTELGPVYGVLHTAGLPGEGFLIHKTRETFRRVLAPKVQGTRNLHECTLEDDLHFFVMASSRTGLAGAPGQTDYTAANAFLDGFAWWRRQRGLPGLSIDWNSWAEIGMAAWSKSSVTGPAVDGAPPLPPGQAGTLLLQALTSEASQLLVVMSGENLSPQKAGVSDDDSKDVSEETLSVAERVERIWARELGYENRIAGDADFYALGGDSITGLNIVQRINSELGQSLNLADLFSRSVLNDFTALLEEGEDTGDAQQESLRAPVRAEYPVSSEQLAVIQAVVSADGPHTAYNLPQFMRLPGDIDQERLEKAFQQLIERHEILRTRLVGIATPRPVMEILSGSSFTLRQVLVEEFDQQHCQDVIRPFDLETGPLFHAFVLKNRDGEKALFFDIHHAVADARTIDILLADLMSLYLGKELPPPGLQQKDAAWLQQQEQESSEHEARSYWLSLFSGEFSVLDLPADSLRPPRHTNRGATLNFMVPHDQLPRLREMARAQSTTAYNIILSLWNILLGRFTQQNELVLAVAVDTRDRQEFSRSSGMFVSLLPLLLSYAEEEKFSELLQRNHARHGDALRHKSFGLNRLLTELQVPVMPERTPLAEVTFSYMNFSSELSADTELQLERMEVINPAAKADLAIFASDTPNQLSFALEYYSDLFTSERIRRMGQQFLTLLQDVLDKGAAVSIRDYVMIRPEEMDRIGHSGFLQPVETENLVEAVLTHARDHAEQPATLSSGISLSWRELESGARRVAAGLRDVGVQPGDSVGLAVAADARLPSLMLGILLNGAVCSLNHFEQDRGETERPGFFITDGEDKGYAGGSVVCSVDGLWTGVDSLPPGQEYSVSGRDPAFTCSEEDGGRTRFSHELMLQFALQMREAVTASRQRAVVAIPPDTALGLQVLWALLLNGCELYLGTLPDREENLVRYVQESGAGVFVAGGALVRQLAAWRPAALSPLARIIALADTPEAGRLSRACISCCPDLDLMTGLFVPGSRLLLAWRYGTSSVAPYYRAGSPAGNVMLEIVDKQGRPLPDGIWGQLVFKGPAAELQERFLADNGRDACRITGRWNRDDELELAGAGPEQSEDALQIGTALGNLPGVREAAVWRRENGKWQGVVSSDENFSPDSSRPLLRRQLPVHLSGIEIVSCSRLPLTREGQLDYHALRNLSGTAGSFSGTTGERAGTEQLIVRMFREILQQKSVGRDDSFFELGGHSLLALQIVNRLNRHTRRKLTIRDLFEHPTPAELAARMVSTETDGTGRISRLTPTGENRFPLSHAQQRLYVLHQTEGGAVAYNMPFAFSTGSDFDLDCFRNALHRLCDRQEILRTSFIEEDGQLLQVVHDECSPLIAVDYLDAEERQVALAGFQHDITLPFALDKAPLFRWHICFLGREEVLLLLVMHHIIGDGWSMQIMFSELMVLYNREKGIVERELPPLRIQYKEYSVWQQNRDWREEAAFWKKTLAGAPNRIELPLDNPLPEQRHPVLGVRTRRLDDTLLSGLREHAVDNGVSLATLLLTLFAVLLYHLTRQPDMVIGMGVAGREQEELEGLIGFFINILPVRIRMDAETDVNDLLGRVNTAVLESLQRQEYPFDLLVREVAPVREANRGVLLNVMFEYQRFSDLSRIDQTSNESSLVCTPLDPDAFMEENSAKGRTAKYDLTLFVQDEPQGCTLRAEFDSEILRAATIENWLAYFEDFMVMVLGDEE